MQKFFEHSPLLHRKVQYVLHAALNGLCLGLLYTSIQFWMMKGGHWLMLLNGVFIGLLLGGSLGILESFVFPTRFRKQSFIILLLIRTLVYSVAVVFWLTVVLVTSRVLFEGLSARAAFAFYCNHGHFFVDFVFSFVACLIVVSAMQISTLHGRGELLKFVLGVYHQPKETERIFMFVDLKSSTTIAEQLGNLTYSRFVKDFFFDLTDAILLSRGEIYQYVGDEIILSWPMQSGMKDGRCIRCFYLMKKTLAARREAYLREYGFFPEFKAGLHGGRVVVTWVGEIKREIVYHGDVVNTTARIQAMCNPLGQEFLISGQLLEKLPRVVTVEATYMDTLLLRGKHQEISLFGLKEKVVPANPIPLSDSRQALA